MDKAKLDKFFLAARDYMQKNWNRELEGVRSLSPETFKHMSARYFMTEYAWAVYGAGFGENALNSVFPALKEAFNDFSLDGISEMTSLEPVLKVFNNERKANCVLRGARLIRKEGFANFKRRIAQQGPDAFIELPGIGPINKDLLARNVGLASVAKNDIWLERLTSLFTANSHSEMTEYLANKFNEAPGVVDVILWRFCNQSGWKSLGYSSLDTLVAGLSGHHFPQNQLEKGGIVMAASVESYGDEVVANVRQFNSDLEAKTDIVTQLSQFRHWYYVPNAGFGPSKFIGYKNMNTAKYRRGEDKDGRDTEVVLREWFRPLNEDSSQYKKLYPQLESLLLRYGKMPRSNAIIHVRLSGVW